MIILLVFSIAKSLSILFRNCSENECFPKKRKKANIVLVHKQNDKKLIKNYRSVSSFPIRGKIIEIIILTHFLNTWTITATF